jgi:hypothetical protein
MKADGIGFSEIAKKLGIGRASVYRALEQAMRDLFRCQKLRVEAFGKASLGRQASCHTLMMRNETVREQIAGSIRVHPKQTAERARLKATTPITSR